MSESFQIYQSNIKDSYSAIAKDFSSLETCENKTSVLADIKSNISSFEKNLRDIEILVVSEGQIDEYFQLYLNSYKGILTDVKKKFKTENEKFSDQEKILTLTPMPVEESLTPKNDSSVKSLNSFEMLEEAKRKTTQIETNGNDIVIEMNNQSDQMKLISVKTNKMNHELVQSSLVLAGIDDENKKANRLVKNVAIGLIIAFICILILKISFSYTYKLKEIS